MPTSMGAMLGGSGAPAAGATADAADLEGVSSEIRGIVEQMRLLAEQRPTLAPYAEQVRTILAQAMIDLARQTPEQTTSGLAIPTSGGGL